MRKCVPIWAVLVAEVVLVLLCVGAYWVYLPFKGPRHRDIDELTRKTSLGMSSSDVIRELGRPSVVTGSDRDLVPYQVTPKKSEEIMCYMEYPWGILVYVDKKSQRVTRLVLVRAP